MRKALLSILVLLIVILIALFMKNGLSIGSFRVYSFQDIATKNDELTKAISDANTENDNYSAALNSIDQSVAELTNTKKAYLDAIAESTDDEIKAATQTKTYTIEYLWSKIGNHATKQGVKLKMEVASSALPDQEYRNLNFTADGEYLAITQFLYNIENDADLDFTIDNFHMTSKQATFTVKDIKIIRENTTAPAEPESVNEETEENTNS